jgi:hypothetical protein
MAETTGFQKDAEGYWIAKDPNAAKEYTIDWGNWLVNGDTLLNVNWNIPVGVAKEAEGITPEGDKAWIKLSGGVLGKNYIITAHIETVQGRIDDYSFRLVIRNN